MKNPKHRGTSKKTEGTTTRRSVIGKVIVLMGLLGHLLYSVATWSRTADQWLDLSFTVDEYAAFTAGDGSNASARFIHLASNISPWTENLTTATRHLPPNARLSTLFSKDNEFHDLRAPLFSVPIPLHELVETGPAPEDCKSTPSFNMSVFESIILDGSITYPPNRSIPNIIHMTSKSRCITSRVRENILQWKFEGYSIYFHDDAAVDRLLDKYFPAFPHLQIVKDCSISGAAKADIWRYLVLWEYGGIYTDIDNAPGKKFEAGKLIEDTDEAWFVVERVGVLSQYFMASSPHHPIMYLALTQCLARLVNLVDEIGSQYVPYVTGPGVTKSAMILFMKDKDNFEKVTAGKYKGIDGRTVTVAGNRKNSNQWVQRESIKNKNHEYTAMNMKHFSHSKDKNRKSSCYEYMYKQVMKHLDTGGAESIGKYRAI